MSNPFEDKPFHVIYTNGRFVRGLDTFLEAEKQACEWNTHAHLNGRSERYLAIPKPTVNTE